MENFGEFFERTEFLRTIGAGRSLGSVRGRRITSTRTLRAQGYKSTAAGQLREPAAAASIDE